jgi:hypothetical protein
MTELVENYADVRRALQGTPFEAFAPDEAWSAAGAVDAEWRTGRPPDAHRSGWLSRWRQ